MSLCEALLQTLGDSHIIIIYYLERKHVASNFRVHFGVIRRGIGCMRTIKSFMVKLTKDKFHGQGRGPVLPIFGKMAKKETPHKL